MPQTTKKSRLKTLIVSGFTKLIAMLQSVEPIPTVWGLVFIYFLPPKGKRKADPHRVFAKTIEIMTSSLKSGL